MYAHRQQVFYLLFSLLTIITLTACRVDQISENSRIENSPHILPTKIIPTILPTDTPEATVNPGQLISKASPLCDNQTAPEGHGPPPYPALILIKNVEENRWVEFKDRFIEGGLVGVLDSNENPVPVPFFEARDAREVSSVICIQETDNLVGYYTDGDPAYQVSWMVKWLSWPDGELYDSILLEGEPPPEEIMEPRNYSQPVYGREPYVGFFDWLTRISKNDSILISTIYDEPDSPQIKTFRIYTPNKLIFSQDGKALSIGYKDAIRIWDLNSHKVVDKFYFPVNVPESGIDTTETIYGLSKDLSHLAIHGYYYDFKSQTPLSSYNGEGSAYISPNSKYLASYKRDSAPDFKYYVIIYELYSWDTQAIIKFEGESVTSIAFSPDGTLLAVGGDGGSLEVWDVPSSKQKFAIVDKCKLTRFDLKISPVGEYLTEVCGDSVRLFNMNDGKLINKFDTQFFISYSVAISPDSKRIALGGSDSIVRLLDVETSELIISLMGHSLGINAVAFSPDGKMLASSSADGTVKLWDLSDLP
jgi:hypothetical protein